MGDKNNKTFADLFSNAASGDGNHEEKEKNVTFDNLFNLSSKDEDSSLNAEKEDKEVFSHDEEKASDSNPFFNVSSDEKKEEDKPVEPQVNFFETNNTSKDNSLDSSISSEKKDVEVFSHDEEKASDSNPFFNVSSDEKKEEDKPVEPQVNFFETNNTSEDNSLDNDSNENRKETNQEITQDDRPLSSNLSSSFGSELVDNSSEKEKESEDSVQEISPFFSSDINDDKNSMLGKINLVENISSNRQAQKLDLSGIKHYNVKVVKKKEPLFKFILGVISYAIFIWLLLIGVALLVYVLDIKIRASKGDYSSPTFNAYVVLTGSMLPEIQVYDVVVTKKVDPSSLKVGDVITFASADTRFLNTIITHRIIRKEYDSKDKTYSFQTQGDNNNVADSALVPQNNIYGKVILKIPKLGYLQEFLASDGGWIIVILIPCLTVISYDVVKLIKGLKKKKYKGVTVQK